MSVKSTTLNLTVPVARVRYADMGEPVKETLTTRFMGFSHTTCEFFPCHDTAVFKQPDRFNCMFCQCPLYWLECPGTYSVIVSGGVERKDCSNCKLPHDGYERSWKLMNLSRFQTKPKPWSGK